MIFSPIVISAVAVLITLVYASYLDIRDRRVPFRTWYPMLAIGMAATIVLFYQKTGNISLIFGYLTLVASFLYADYLDNHEPGTPFRLPYIGVVLALPVLSWFILPALSRGNVPELQLIPWYVMFAGLVGYVTYREYKKQPERRLTAKQAKKESRRESNVEEVLSRWYFVLVVVILAIASFYMIGSGSWGVPGIYIALAAVFCGVFYIFGQMRLFGGADAWALIFIAFCIPTFPITPLFDASPIGFLAFSVLINALILNLLAPLGIFLINMVRKNRAPLQYMFFGFPVEGEKIQDAWGFVMEDFTEKSGKVERKFIGFWESLRRMRSDEGRVYTKDLREHPDEFETELGVYKKAGKVWISYAVPFILPITAGLITAIVFGDFLFTLMRIVTGGA
ncbi:A24 family peptidase C-terminal domain-containing protein [Methanoregula sp.]|uniref:A24 family peptidase C-terminal domain-containing protein n=1 Tax=Methanoregula sp. TaxID=2052170 RepID=UPI002C37F342|nr:A24 family peptidase C-terminal domain-containing protein [Methanoregula sp.]HVP97207.1 A24 family peptidase C-terminal domain-containing protein [Methanoregula sp.]